MNKEKKYVPVRLILTEEICIVMEGRSYNGGSSYKFEVYNCNDYRLEANSAGIRSTGTKIKVPRGYFGYFIPHFNAKRKVIIFGLENPLVSVEDKAVEIELMLYNTNLIHGTTKAHH